MRVSHPRRKAVHVIMTFSCYTFQGAQVNMHIWSGYDTYTPHHIYIDAIALFPSFSSMPDISLSASQPSSYIVSLASSDAAEYLDWLHVCDTDE